MEYKRRVTGRFRGTTDEILQWVAHKHGIAEDVVRAVAVQESWWRMSAVGDGGDSFGIMQMRRPYTAACR
jgi:membrane-bound lytic murein transglycosylase MltF